VAAARAHPRVHAGHLDQPRAAAQALTLVPLDLYFKDGRVKATLALAKGKKSYDKRHDMAERDSRREIQKAFGRHLKGRR
jgi:SsrA-binding protein